MTDQAEKLEQEWWAAFPAPKAKCPEITADELMALFDDMDTEGAGKKDFLLVDVRRTDWEGGTIRSSLNLPAQSFYQSRKPLLDLCHRASIHKIILYCGSSSGRAPRCASWLQDLINDFSTFSPQLSQKLDNDIQVLVLKGGIKGWVREFEGSFVDGFVEGCWK